MLAVPSPVRIWFYPVKAYWQIDLCISDVLLVCIECSLLSMCVVCTFFSCCISVHQSNYLSKILTLFTPFIPGSYHVKCWFITPLRLVTLWCLSIACGIANIESLHHHRLTLRWRKETGAMMRTASLWQPTAGLGSVGLPSANSLTEGIIHLLAMWKDSLDENMRFLFAHRMLKQCSCAASYVPGVLLPFWTKLKGSQFFLTMHFTIVWDHVNVPGQCVNVHAPGATNFP